MRKFKAFISYKHVSSTRFAENLELAIKAYAKPIYRLPVAVFRDEKYLKPGLDLPTMIRSALDQSEYLIYLASPEAASSDWVRRELEQWCSDAMRCERLIVILTAGRIAVDARMQRLVWEQTTALPASLATTITTIPFYVDLAWAERPEQQTLLDPDYKKAINVIVAKLRDVDPIELSGEEILQYRRNRRIRSAFLGAITVLATLLAATAWFAWRQMLDADARAREATSRRLAAEADRIAEDRIDTALLLMAQAFRMGNNAALLESWWRLLGSATLPETYLPVRASSLYFEPDGRLIAVTPNGEQSFAVEDGHWNTVPGSSTAEAVQASESITWIWSGGCEQGFDCDENGVWECAEFEGRIIGPYGDTDDFCVTSRIRVPDWCDGKTIEMPGFDVRVRRLGRRVELSTNRAAAYFGCRPASDEGAATGASRPTLIAGTPEVFSEAISKRLAEGGAAIRWLSRSFDGNWLAVVREGGAAEIWQVTDGRPFRPRPGMQTIALPTPVQAIASSRSGAVALALAPSEPGGKGAIVFWKQYERMLAGQDPDLTIKDGWRTRGRLGGVLEISPRGERIASGADVEVLVWDTVSGQQIRRIQIGRAAAIEASISVDAQWLALQLHPLDGASDPPPKAFRLQPGRDHEQLGREAVRALAFHPDKADLLLTAGASGISTQIIDKVDRGQQLATEVADFVTVEPLRQLIGAALADSSLLVRTLDDTGESFRSGRRDSLATALAFHTPDELILRTSLSALEAWDWRSNAWLTVSAGAHKDVVSFPDGLTLTLTDDGRALAFELHPARWLALTCGIVRRNLSHAEWRRHIGGSFDYECACPAHPPGAGWPSDSCPSAVVPRALPIR